MTTPGSTAEHQKLLQETFLYFQKMFPKGRIFKRQQGLFLNLRGMKTVVGIPGQGDAYAILPINVFDNIFLLHIEIEFKTGNAVLSKEQKIWNSLIESLGGLYIVVRKPEDIGTEIQKKIGKFL